MKKNITMDMIATKAGVSKSTVSYVLSGKKQLSESVKEKVLSTAEGLGYRPQKVAPELFSDQTLRIRLDFDQNQSTNDSAVCRHEIIRGILDQLSGTNYELCISPSLQSEKKTQADNDTLKGVISVFRKKPATAVIEDGPNQLPVVYIGHHDKEAQSFLVDADGLGAGYQAATWVIKRGADRVLFVKDQDWPLWYEQYEIGFQMACKELKAVWDSEGFVTLETSAEMMSVINQSKSFSAVIVPSATLANQLMYHPSCRNATILVMKQFSGIVQPDIRNPGTEFPAYEMGKEAADMLLGIISKQRVAHNSVIISCDFNKGT
jgi:DNA-binding LacI/PurR family transcriptional regulator